MLPDHLSGAWAGQGVSCDRAASEDRASGAAGDRASHVHGSGRSLSGGADCGLYIRCGYDDPVFLYSEEDSCRGEAEVNGKVQKGLPVTDIL